MEQKEIIVFIIIATLTTVLFIGAIIFFILFYRKKMILQIKENETVKLKHQKELLSTQMEIQTQTMQHIGREIHDNIGQKLTLASLYTQQLAYENKAPNIKENIENVSAIINQSLTELRELSKSLTDNTIDSYDISRLIERECSKINELKMSVVSFASTTKNLKLDYQKKNVLLRIVQEFLQNSVKHALCQNILISLEKKEKKLILSLEDDGKGFDITKMSSNGIGLSNMKKRTEILGGTFILESKENQGTKVNIEIPL